MASKHEIDYLQRHAQRTICANTHTGREREGETAHRYMKCEQRLISVSCVGVCVCVCCRLSKEKLLMVLHECTNEIVQARLTALPMTEPAAAAAPTSLPLPGIKPGVVRQIYRFRIVCDFKLHR